MGLLSKFFIDPNEKELKKLQPLVEDVNNLEKDFEKFTKQDFLNKTKELKQKLKQGESKYSILPQAFALVRQASKKTLNQRHGK